jgi:hypothetical protein
MCSLKYSIGEKYDRMKGNGRNEDKDELKTKRQSDSLRKNERE